MEKKDVFSGENRSPRLMTRREVAQFLRCSQRHVDNLKALAGLPFRKLGHLVRFEEQAVLKWLEQQGNG